MPSGDGAVVDKTADSTGNDEKAPRSAGAGPGSASRVTGVAWFRTPRGVTTSAIVLIAAQLIWRATLLRHANFFQDDYQLIEQASGESFGWHYLMQMHSVHLMPGGFLLVKIVTAISPYSWPWAAGTTLFLQLLAGLAVLRMLRALFGTRPAILAPLALFLLSPLTVAALGWWAAALNVLPVEIAVAMAVAAHVEYLRGGKRSRAVEEVAWVVVGLLFFETAVVIPVLLLALTICYFGSDGHPGPLRGAVGGTLRPHWRLWAAYLGVVVGYGALYWTSKTGSVKIGTVSPASHAALGFAGRLIFQTFVPGVFGGPWQWYAPQQNSYGWATPAGAAVWLTCIALALVVLATVRYRARAGRAWLILLGWLLVADVAPLIAGRLNALTYPTVVVFAQDTRYVADAVPVLALCVALAFIPLQGEADPLRRPVRFPPVRRLAAVAGGAAIVVASMVSTQQYAGFLKGGEAQAYLSNARQVLRSGQSLRGFVDTYAMPDMILNSFGQVGYVSQVLAPLADSAQRQVMASGAVALNNAVAFSPDGRLLPLVDATDPSQPLGPSNGFGQCAGGSRQPTSITVSLPASLGWSLYVVRLDFTDGSPSSVDFRFGLGSRTLKLPSSLHRAYFSIVGNGNTVVLSNITSARGFCVSRVAVGDPVFG